MGFTVRCIIDLFCVSRWMPGKDGNIGSWMWTGMICLACRPCRAILNLHLHY